MAINRFLLIIIALVVTAILVWFLVLPQYKNFRALQADVSLAEAEYNAKYAYYAEVLRLFSELKKRQPAIDKIEKALPDNVSLAPIIYFLQKKTTESGLIIKDLFFSKISAPNGKEKSLVKEITFSISVVGTYTSLKNFLLSVEKSANLFTVNSISFSSSPLAPEAGKTQQSHSFLLEIKTNSY